MIQGPSNVRGGSAPSGCLQPDLLADDQLRRNIEFICGCAYGENSRDKVQDSTYYRVAGKDYWHLISGDPNMLERLLAELHRQLQAVEPVSLEDPA